MAHYQSTFCPFMSPLEIIRVILMVGIRAFHEYIRGHLCSSSRHILAITNHELGGGSCTTPNQGIKKDKAGRTLRVLVIVYGPIFILVETGAHLINSPIGCIMVIFLHLLL